MAHVCTFSDLHLYCRRSHAQLYMNDVCDAAREADIFVLNGDIIDIRWTTLPSEQETVADALDWLDDVTSCNPMCQFHYVIGNHDNVQIFLDALEPFAEAHPNLTYHPQMLRLGDAVFLHGDIAHREMSVDDFAKYRDYWLNDSKRGEVVNFFYDVASLCRIPPYLHRVTFPTEVVVKRIATYLNSIGLGAESGVRRVFFGHTHVPVEGYEYAGLLFYNGGAAMPGVHFNILRQEIEL
jgi:UDP-2,3-diacylglucosamine hydrolase